MTDVEHAGAGINLILILIFNWIYERVAFWLTDKELRWVRVIVRIFYTVDKFIFISCDCSFFKSSRGC